MSATAGTTREELRDLAERLRSAITATPFALGAGERLVTASFGAALSLPTCCCSTSELVVAADRALYRAKHKGRNQVAFDTGDLSRAALT